MSTRHSDNFGLVIVLAPRTKVKYLAERLCLPTHLVVVLLSSYLVVCEELLTLTLSSLEHGFTKGMTYRRCRTQ
jgi:hypothetical protein